MKLYHMNLALFLSLSVGLLFLFPQARLTAQEVTILPGRDRQLDFDRLQKISRTTPPHMLQRLGSFNWTITMPDRPLLMHPDGQHAFVQAHEFLSKIKLNDGSIVKKFPIRSHLPVLITPDAQFLIFASSGNELSRFNLKTGKTQHVTTHIRNLSHLSLSPDGSHLATFSQLGFQRKIEIWNMNTLKHVHTTEPLGSIALTLKTKLVWSKDNNRLFFPSHFNRYRRWRDRILQYDIQAQSLTALEGFRLPDDLIQLQRDQGKRNARAVEGLYLNHDETEMITLDTMGLVIRWDLATGGMLNILMRTTARMSHHTLSPDGQRLSISLGAKPGSESKTGELPALPQPGDLLQLKGYVGHAMAILSLDPQQQTPVRQLLKDVYGRSSWSIDQETLYVHGPHTIHIQPVSLEKASSHVSLPHSMLTSIRKKDGSLLSLGHRGDLIHWGWTDGQLKILQLASLPIQGFYFARSLMSLSPDEKYLVILDPVMNAHLIEVASMKYLHRITNASLNGASSISFKADHPDQFFVTSRSGILPLRIENDQLHVGKAHDLPDELFARSSVSIPDADQVLIPRQSELALVNLVHGSALKFIPTFTQQKAMKFQSEHPLQLSLFPNSSWVLILYGKGLRIVDYSNGQIILDRALTVDFNRKSKRKSYRKHAYQAALPIDQQHYLLADDQGNWELYQIESESPIQTGSGHAAGLRHLNLLPDHRLLVVSMDTTASLWQLNHQKAIPRLTHQEARRLWEQFKNPDTQLKAQLYFSKMSHHHLDLFAQVLQPAQLNEDQIDRLILQLNAANAELREEARQELLSMGKMVISPLKAATARAINLEHFQACHQILEEIQSELSIHPDILRQLMIIKALKDNPNEKAHKILKKLANGHPESQVTQAAREALIR